MVLDNVGGRLRFVPSMSSFVCVCVCVCVCESRKASTFEKNNELWKTANKRERDYFMESERVRFLFTSC